MSEEPSPLEAGWHWVLNVEADPHVPVIAARAAEEPILRSLFPYPSNSNLRFSTKFDYPYDLDLPYVLTTPEGEYEARDGDHAPMIRGSIDDVVVAVAKRMSELLRARAK